jgi:hypothetical protein
VSVDRQVPGDSDQPGSGGAVLDVQARVVRPSPQHGFLHQVLGAAAIIAGQHGGQSQQGGPVLGVQAAEGDIRVLGASCDGLIAGHAFLLSRTPGAFRLLIRRPAARAHSPLVRVQELHHSLRVIGAGQAGDFPCQVYRPIAIPETVRLG